MRASRYFLDVLLNKYSYVYTNAVKTITCTGLSYMGPEMTKRSMDSSRWKKISFLLASYPLSSQVNVMRSKGKVLLVELRLTLGTLPRFCLMSS